MLRKTILHVIIIFLFSIILTSCSKHKVKAISTTATSPKTPEQSASGNLVLTTTVGNSNTLAVDESKALTLTLTASKNVENLAVSINTNGGQVMLNPSLCVLSSESNTCTIIATAIESGTVAIVALTNGYANSAPVNLKITPSKIKHLTEIAEEEDKSGLQHAKKYYHIVHPLAIKKATEASETIAPQPVVAEIPVTASELVTEANVATATESIILPTQMPTNMYIGVGAGAGWNNTSFPAATFRINYGYNLTNAFAIEAGITGLTQSGTGANQSMQYYDLSVKGTMPLGDTFDIFGQIGGAYGNPGATGATIYSTTNQGILQGGWNFLTAVGIDFNVTQRFGLNLSNYYYYGAPNPQGNTNVVLAGVKYKF